MTESRGVWGDLRGVPCLTRRKIACNTFTAFDNLVFKQNKDADARWRANVVKKCFSSKNIFRGPPNGVNPEKMEFESSCNHMLWGV